MSSLTQELEDLLKRHSVTEETDRAPTPAPATKPKRAPRVPKVPKSQPIPIPQPLPTPMPATYIQDTQPVAPKPKRVMSEKQLESLRLGREKRAANRAQRLQEE